MITDFVGFNTNRGLKTHVVFACVAAMLCSVRPLEAGPTLGASGPSATFSPTNTLTGFSVTVSGLGITTGDSVSLQYTTGTGTPIGAPVTTTVRPGNTVSAPPPPIPAGATGLGNKVVITFVDANGFKNDTNPIVWYNSALIWGVSPSIKIDPFGLPGITSPQKWFIDDPSAHLTALSTPLGTFTSTITSSNFDLAYTNLGGGLYDARVTGDTSYIRLGNSTFIDFPNGLDFGNLRYSFNTGTTAGGTFDFSAIGLQGLWSWDSITHYTHGSGVGSTFDAPAISTSAPEPSALTLLSTGTLGLLGYGWRRLKKVAA
jgi:hypothetical protein